MKVNNLIRISIMILLLIVSSCKKDDNPATYTIMIKDGADKMKDAVVWDEFPDNNYGVPYLTWTTHKDIRAYRWTYQGKFTVQRSFFEFAIPEEVYNSEIVSATLSLYYHPNSNFPLGHSNSNGSKIFLVTEEWDERTINWNNQPSISESHFENLSPSDSAIQNYINIDVRSLIELQINQPNLYHGFMLRLNYEELDQSSSLIFASSDADNSQLHPELNIVYRK